jgi:hypothetical protein
MAYSKEQWARAKFLFGLGTALSEIEKDCGISKGQISKRSTREGWEKETEAKKLKSEILEFEAEKETLEKKKETLRVKKETITRKMALTLSDFEITILDEVVTSEAGIKSLITSTQSLAMIRANEMLSRGTKTTLMKVGQYDSKGNRTGETYEPFETNLEPADLRNTIEAVDKASITLGINQRHAPKMEISNTNAQQNNDNSVKTIVYEVVGANG